VMFTLHDLQPQRRMLVLYGEQTPDPSGRDRVPPGSTVIDLGGQWPHLDPESREIIALRLIESVARGARLHLRDSAFAASFFGTYWPVLRAHPCVFYRFSDPRVPEGDDVFGRAAGQLFVSDHIEKLALVISDTETLVEHDRWRIGIWPERFQALPRRRPPLVNDSQIAVRTARRKGRVLWASRLERGKRPELVPRIAGLLAIAAPHVSVDVFGRTVMGHFDVAGFKGLDNVVYRGAYEDFERLDHAGYDCFLYTGWSDGLPAVVLEAMAAGLPVIAPAVEGIGEMVMDGGTGILLAVPADDGEAARMYVDAIVRLLDDPARRTRLALAALQRLNTRHAVKVHADRVRALFFPAGAPA